jgi:hypothetical protein
MPYAIIRRAIEERRSVTAVYDNYVRYFSPHVLGLDRQAWPSTIGWQYGGGRPGGLPSGGDWCFFHVWALVDVRPNDDGWKAGGPGGKPRQLITRVDIQV